MAALGLLPVAACGGSAVESSGSQAARCDEPVVDTTSGLTQCANGLVHRIETAACTLPDGVDGTANEQPPPKKCTSDAECGDWPLGYCPAGAPGPFGGSHCASGCLRDSDCQENQLCLCDGSTTGGKCIRASCRTNADCGASSACARATGLCGEENFVCTTSSDQCNTDADCPTTSPSSPHGSCIDRECNPTAACGRPFLVEEAPRFAEVTPRADWLDISLTPSLKGLSPLERTELVAHWSRLGQMEHASIAAFARFNLQLLALGAPSDLVEACNRALADETAHAKLCFAFASAYAGEKLGPSKLDVTACFDDVDLVAVTKLVIAEGCIGETTAALEALEDADRATDPVVRNALLRIASDERNHAELAYRFLRWALGQSSAEQRAEIAAFCALERPQEQRLVAQPLLDACLGVRT